MNDRERPNGPGDYEVGYGRPPKHGQFQPGHTRSKGPRKRKSIESEIKKALTTKVTLRQNGEITKVPLGEALMKKLIAKALAGKRWAFEHLMQEIRRVDASHGGTLISALLDEDRAVLQQLAQKAKDHPDEV